MPAYENEILLQQSPPRVPFDREPGTHGTHSPGPSHLCTPCSLCTHHAAPIRHCSRVNDRVRKDRADRAGRIPGPAISQSVLRLAQRAHPRRNIWPPHQPYHQPYQHPYLGRASCLPGPQVPSHISATASFIAHHPCPSFPPDQPKLPSVLRPSIPIPPPSSWSCTQGTVFHISPLSPTTDPTDLLVARSLPP